MWKILIISYKMAIIWMPEYLVMVIKSAFRNSQASIWTNVGQPLKWNLNLEKKSEKSRYAIIKLVCHEFNNDESMTYKLSITYKLFDNSHEHDITFQASITVTS